ncbi:MAG: sigma-70 family RNA polymerase sigma factor [Deltaproteobacteria bacterium]
MLSDEALYEQLLRGDLRAFDALYERYERPLFGFLLGQLRDRTEAEDALHDAFLAVLHEMSIGRSATSFRAWLYQVARNLCLNRIRARNRATRALAAVALAPLDAQDHPEGALMDHQATESLRRAVEQLPAPLAELYHLRAGGLSYEELAQLLELPLGTVKSRMHEMVSRLRGEMHR